MIVVETRTGKRYEFPTADAWSHQGNVVAIVEPPTNLSLPATQEPGLKVLATFALDNIEVVKHG